MTTLSIVPITKYSEKEASSTISLYLAKAFIDSIATIGIKLLETKDSKIIIRIRLIINYQPYLVYIFLSKTKNKEQCEFLKFLPLESI